MSTQLAEIGPDLYRISTYSEAYGIQFNQFLLFDDEPFLMHAGFKAMFGAMRDAVAKVLDPARLRWRWIGFSHFESDECGALNEWRTLATMHGSSFTGDGRQAVCGLAEVVREALGAPLP